MVALDLTDDVSADDYPHQEPECFITPWLSMLHMQHCAPLRFGAGSTAEYMSLHLERFDLTAELYLSC